MKTMSHFDTTVPLSFVTVAPNTRHFSKFSKFGPDTMTCAGLMTPARVEWEFLYNFFSHLF